MVGIGIDKFHNVISQENLKTCKIRANDRFFAGANDIFLLSTVEWKRL